MSRQKNAPLRVINSVAPIRICDNGGWTDTWFAGHGKIFNIGVYPYAEVQIHVYARNVLPEQVIIYAENYGERYALRLDHRQWDRHPLLEAAIERMGISDDIAIQATIFSAAPVGASTGTSAAVAVALVGALDHLTPGRLTPHQVAYEAHAIETEMLHLQSGIQDQLCSAYGGVNFIEMFEYPHASVSQIQVSNDIWWELERRLALIYLGKAHSSSQVHESVIHRLEQEGAASDQLARLRSAAERSRDALYAGDFSALGRAMITNTEAQRDLHPALISEDAQQVIDIAREHGAVGWKVNGAGGEGGSITLLGGASSSAQRGMIRAIEEENTHFQAIPIHLSRHGLRTWESK